MNTNTNERVSTHQNQGHNVMVINGTVRCTDCQEDIDTSGHRPGVVSRNQER